MFAIGRRRADNFTGVLAHNHVCSDHTGNLFVEPENQTEKLISAERDVDTQNKACCGDATVLHPSPPKKLEEGRDGAGGGT